MYVSVATESAFIRRLADIQRSWMTKIYFLNGFVESTKVCEDWDHTFELVLYLLPNDEAAIRPNMFGSDDYRRLELLVQPVRHAFFIRVG